MSPPRRRAAFVVIALAVAGFAEAAPAQSFHLPRREKPSNSRPVPEKAFPFDVTWVLQSVNGKPVASADPPSFALDRTLRARGFAGCNAFSMAFYPVKNQTLASGAIATTRKACAPDVMASERAFLVALHSLPKWSVTEDGDLVLTAPRTAMRFHRGL